jgi:hypothetical protein
MGERDQEARAQSLLALLPPQPARRPAYHLVAMFDKLSKYIDARKDEKAVKKEVKREAYIAECTAEENRRWGAPVAGAKHDYDDEGRNTRAVVHRYQQVVGVSLHSDTPSPSPYPAASPRVIARLPRSLRRESVHKLTAGTDGRSLTSQTRGSTRSTSGIFKQATSNPSPSPGPIEPTTLSRVQPCRMDSTMRRRSVCTGASTTLSTSTRRGGSSRSSRR